METRVGHTGVIYKICLKAIGSTLLSFSNMLGILGSDNLRVTMVCGVFAPLFPFEAHPCCKAAVFGVTMAGMSDDDSQALLRRTDVAPQNMEA